MNRTNDSSKNRSDADGRVGVISTRVCAVMLVLYALFYARSLAVPIAMAFVMYMVLRPLVRQGSRLGVPPAVGAAAILVTLIVSFGFATYLVVEPAQQMIAKAPQHVGVVKEKLRFLTHKLNQVNDAKEELTEASEEANENDVGEPDEEEPVPVQVKQPNWTNNYTYLSGTGNLVSFLTICAALLYFLLATGDDLLRSIMHALPDFTARRRLIEIIENVQEGLGSYLARISSINAGLGIAVGIAMWLLGMPSPAVWGVMAFAFNFIPIVGALVGACIIFLVALVSFDPTYYAFIVAGTYITLTSLEGQFITPSILGRSMSMSPVLVFLSIVLWGWMWGIMGVFLSIPILIAIRMACEGYDGLQPLAFVLGAEVPQPKRKEGDADEQSEIESSSGRLPEVTSSGSASSRPIASSVGL
ncbi:pheromone autoinducer 2 transporter [Novipirellula aureliae]|uniref:Pheromone autoinducer 2 transporter n=1 Tax=Novipirellula aureliae TaxID=2527966 RepID=A0A5C6E773_9BACT|nr:AI-2E family transporter [Novipirellula aureliae]TWU44405.1 pheromone autoinducer 2 transporter [Novipirellula aureliae]